jgi:PAS domain S-box-containing protein
MQPTKKHPLHSCPPSSEPETFFRTYTEVVEMLVASRPSEEIFIKIALLIERLSPVEAWCSIIRRDGDPPKLELAAAPSIPDGFIDILRNLDLATEDGICGRAIANEDTVVVDDILADPTYEKFHSFSRESVIKASWAVPVFSSANEIIAIITVYYHERRRPEDKEVRQVEDLRHLISLTIKKNITSEKLTQSNLRFRSVAAATSDAIWDWDAQEGSIWWSEGFSKIFGLETSGSAPSLEEWKRRIHPDDRERILNSLKDPQLGVTKHWAGEYRFFRADGSIAHASDQAVVIFDSSGNITRMIGGMSDISRQKKAQQELTSLNRALEMLRSSNQILIRASNEKQLLTDICKVVSEVGGYKLAWVGYAEATKEMPIIPMAFHGDHQGYLDKIRLSYSENHPTGNGPGSRTIRSGQPVICEDIRKENSSYQWRQEALERGFRSMVCLPLKDDTKCFGFIAFVSTKTNAVGEDEKKLLHELADNLAFGILAIRNQAKQKTTRDAIVKVAKTVSGSSGNDFYHDLTANMVESLGADGGLIGKFDAELQSVSTLSFILDGIHQKNLTYSLRGTPCENVTSKDVCLYEREIQDLFPTDHALIEMGMDSYAGIALFGNDGEQFGIISVIFRKPISDPSLVTHMLTIFAERAASELELHDADARIREQASLLDKARDAIFSHDMRHGIKFWNKSAERLYGHSKSAAITRSARELLQADTEGYDLAHSQTLEHGEWIGELHQIDKDGKALIVESRWNLVRNHAGDPTSILTINTDVTGHRHLERQFLRAQRLDSIGTLAGGLAHDLNNVLAPISMSIELLRSSVNDARGNKLLDIIAHNSLRGAEMITQILSFARGMEGRRTRVSGGEIISELTGIIRDTFAKNIRIETHLDLELWPILGDATQLHQVLLNLCVNARDAMPEGGDLLISASNKTLSDECVSSNIDARTGPYVCIRVEDSGTGIPPEIIGKIYDPFFTTKEVGKGTGLGLSTTLTIIKSHGGFINSFSEPGRGTEFTVYLPAMVERSEVESGLPPKLGLEKGNGENILVIDDEEAIREMTAEILHNSGYQAITASSGEEAISIYTEKSDEIDLVITDMMMPGIGGAETIERLLEIKPHSQFIAVSGIRVHNEIAQGKFPELSYFLQKPFSANALLEVLSLALKNTPRNWE